MTDVRQLRRRRQPRYPERRARVPVADARERLAAAIPCGRKQSAAVTAKAGLAPRRHGRRVELGGACLLPCQRRSRCDICKEKHDDSDGKADAAQIALLESTCGAPQHRLLKKKKKLCINNCLV